MSEKIPPLSDDSILAQAYYKIMLDDLDKCADLIEGSKDKGERAEAIACLRSVIAKIKQGYADANSVVYISAHVKGQKSAPRNARNARLAPSKKLDDYLEEHWFSLDKKPRKDHFVNKHYPLFIKLLEDEHKRVHEDNKEFKKPIGEEQFKKRLSPSQRRKSVAP